MAAIRFPPGYPAHEKLVLESLQVTGATEGEALVLPSGNVLHNYGGLPIVREATREGEVVWEAGYMGASAIHRSSPLTLEDLYNLRD